MNSPASVIFRRADYLTRYIHAIILTPNFPCAVDALMMLAGYKRTDYMNHSQNSKILLITHEISVPRFSVVVWVLCVRAHPGLLVVGAYVLRRQTLECVRWWWCFVLPVLRITIGVGFIYTVCGGNCGTIVCH
jgi:hypothetical protein